MGGAGTPHGGKSSAARNRVPLHWTCSKPDGCAVFDVATLARRSRQASAALAAGLREPSALRAGSRRPALGRKVRGACGKWGCREATGRVSRPSGDAGGVQLHPCEVAATLEDRPLVWI